MRNHLRVNGNLKTPSRPGSTGTRSTWEDTIGEEDYSAIFREQFCVAASELAGHMDTDLQNLGILYEGILMTGTLTTEFKTKRSKYGFARGTIAAQVENKDIEAGLVTPSLFGKGQLLFVVRKADRAEASRLMSAGYRFAQTDQVSDQLARSMQINRQDLIDTVERLRDYCQRGSCMPSPGTYLACFALRAAFKTSGGSWDILVPKTNLCQLPMVALSSRHLELWQIDLLAQMDGLSVNQCIEHLRNQVRNRSDQKSEFMLHVLTKIAVLVKEVPEPFFQQAVFAARPIKTQRHVAGDGVPSQATIFAFCIIPDVHIASVKSDVLRYTPLSFFKCQQRVHAGSPDHAILAGKNHREFGSLLAQQKELSTLSVSSRRGSILAPRHVRGVRMWLSKNSSPRHPDVQPDNSSEKGLVSAAVRDDDNSCSNAFGGILVRKDIAVNSDVELKELGTTTEAGVAATEEPTFADELFKITSSKWQKS
ncbi:hypothetical protein K432DRAFT_377689 [Lepidopterella palustris CBS 459.81]|uniref:Uncharacterized protein n=1 Tax=Lepidopterella palustris CBS 459.81 TaxID=1314670 RepID=A0A8E2EJU6_9PEZI|nr:hypothetical protein K432DRAFT_377689 [Lepidopterella palustris CBS 459.81]